MKAKLAALAAGLVLSAGLTAPAHAFTPGGSFTLTGVVTVTKAPLTISCNVTANVDASGAIWPDGYIQNFTLTPGSFLCAGITSTGLSWRIRMLSPTSVQIDSVTLNAPALGACGPATLPGTWDNTSPGTLTVISAPLGACTTSWNLKASPAQTLP